MTHRTFDRAQEVTTTTGVGALALGGATARMFTYADEGAADGDTFWGLIEHITAIEVEIALCTYHASGNYITRAAPLKSTTGGTIDFSPGQKIVSNVAPASKQIIADNLGNFLFPGQLLTQGVRETVKAVAITAGALPIDLTAATIFTAALNANVTALNITGMPAGLAGSFILELAADGTPRTFAQPGSVVPMTGTYTPTSTNGKKDRLLYDTLDGGTTWRMWIVAQSF